MPRTGPRCSESPGQSTWCRWRSITTDIRFTTKGDTLYAIVLVWPEDRKVTVKSLAAGSALAPREIKGVSLLGSSAPVAWKRTADGLAVELPSQKPCECAYVLKIEQR